MTQEEKLLLSKDLEILAKRICGYGFYDLDGTPREVIEKYLAIGAKWQKEQMMKDAIDGVVICDEKLTRGYRDILFKFPEGLNVGDKVKLIVIKED